MKERLQLQMQYSIILKNLILTAIKSSMCTNHFDKLQQRTHFGTETGYKF